MIFSFDLKNMSSKCPHMCLLADQEALLPPSSAAAFQNSAHDRALHLLVARPPLALYAPPPSPRPSPTPSLPSPTFLLDSRLAACQRSTTWSNFLPWLWLWPLLPGSVSLLYGCSPLKSRPSPPHPLPSPSPTPPPFCDDSDHYIHLICAQRHAFIPIPRLPTARTLPSPSRRRHHAPAPTRFDRTSQ